LAIRVEERLASAAKAPLTPDPKIVAVGKVGSSRAPVHGISDGVPQCAKSRDWSASGE
jgi:hypothetical protein